MIWNFTCSTKDCENEKNPVRLLNAINPVLCSICHKLSDALETNEEQPQETQEPSED